MPATKKNDSFTDEQIVNELRAVLAEGGTISTNSTQRIYQIGYGRAKRLVDSILAPGAAVPAPKERVLAIPAAHATASEVLSGAVALGVDLAKGQDKTVEVVTPEVLSDEDDDRLPDEGGPMYKQPETAIVPLKTKMVLADDVANVAETMKAKHQEYKEKQSKDGAKALAEVEKLIAANSNLESQLEHSYVKLGQLLLIVSQGEFYRSIEVEDEDTGEMVPCRSMGRYLESLAEKYNKGKRMLQYYLSTVKILMPAVDAEKLNTMGIQKARKLADITRQTDILPDAQTVKQVIEAPTVEAVAQLLFDKYKLTKVEQPKGTWYPLEGFYVEDNDRALLDEAFKKAARILKFSEAVPEWMRRRESLKLMAAEFLNVPEKSQE